MVRGSASLDLDLKTLVNYRDFHSSTHAGNWRMKIEPIENGVQVIAFDGATPFYLKCAGATCEPQHEWYRNYFLPVEKERGLDDQEDQLYAALFRTKLKVGATVTFMATIEPAARL